MTTWEPEDEAEFLRNSAMTISLDEQIAYVEQWHTGNETTDSILLSLRRLKRIEELMREPTNEMGFKGMDAWVNELGTPLTRYAAIYRTMSAALLKQVEEEVK